MKRLATLDEVKAWKKPLHSVFAKFASLYLRTLPTIDVIGITGSVGKTLTQNAIYAVLSQKFRTVAGDENLDPTFRIPKTILKARPWDQIIILEYGVEHPGDMDYYLQIAKPKIAVLTLISQTHTKYFKSLAGIFEEKAKLIKAVPKNGHVLLNASEPFSQRAKSETKAPIYWFGPSAQNGIKISHFSQSINGSKFRLHFKGQKASVSCKFIGKHQLLSAYIAATVGNIYGLTLNQIALGLSKTKPPIHRLNLIRNENYVIIDDTYNSSPQAAQEALVTLQEIAKRKKKIVILGQMKDLGSLEKIAHVNLGQKIAKSRINYLITVGKIAGLVAQSAKKAGFEGKTIQVLNTKLATQTLKKLNLKNSVILIKGSRHVHLERIVYALQHNSTVVNCYHCGQLK